MKRSIIFFLGFVVFFSLSACSKSNTQEGEVRAAEVPVPAPAANSGHGLDPYDFPLAFAIADKDGKHLLVNYYDDAGYAVELAEPGQYTQAIGAYGEIVRVSYDCFLEEEETYSSNYVYNAVSGRLLPDKYYVLTTERLLPDAMIRLNPPLPDPSDPYKNIKRLRAGLKFEDYIFIAKEQRKVQWAEQLAITEEGGMIALVVYENEGSRSDYSIVHQCGPDILFWDDGGYFNISGWSVEAGAPPVYEPLFLARLGNSLVMALGYTPPGTGTELAFLYEDSGKFVIR